MKNSTPKSENDLIIPTKSSVYPLLLARFLFRVVCDVIALHGSGYESSVMATWPCQMTEFGVGDDEKVIRYF